MKILDNWRAGRKNRAIREGRWISQEYEVYESALSNALALVDAIRGKEIDKKYRDGWDDDIVGPGSQNHPLLGAACEFWYQRTRNLPKMNAVLDAWLKYSRLHYMTGETYSSFIYGLWIHGAILTVAFGARLVGRDDVAERLYGIMRTAYSLWALGCSGDTWTGNYKGKAVAWAGSRSWITVKDRYDGHYYDQDGVLNQPDNIDYTFATNFLAAALEWVSPVKWIKDLVDAMRTVDPADPWGLSETEKGTLRLVALAQEPMSSSDAFDRVVGWLREAVTAPAITCRIVKTSDWVGFLALTSIHPKSTSFLYGRFWFRDGRPDLWWNQLWSKVDRRAGWLNFDPSVRKAGVHGYVEVEHFDGAYEFTGERVEGKTYSLSEMVNGEDSVSVEATIPPDTFYYELAGGHRDPASYLPGPRLIRLVYSERVYDVSFGPDGVDVHWPEGGNGNGDDDCSEGSFFERLWCRIRKWLGL